MPRRCENGRGENAEAMLYTADCRLRANKTDQVVGYGNKALEAINTRGKREGASDADFSSQKSSLSGNANFASASDTPCRCATVQ